MTEEQKEILIAKMLDAPSALSDEDLDAIRHDEELRDIYDASSAVSNACVSQPELDVAAEWRRFRPRIRRRPTAMRWIMRVAAIFLGVIFVSAVAVRMINSLFTGDQQPVIAKLSPRENVTEVPSLPQSPQAVVAEEDPIRVEPAIDKRRSMAPTRHIAKTEKIRPETTPHQAETDIDVDEFIRIQQARIDNDLAMLVAESYLEEFDDLLPILDAAGVYSQELDNAVRKVTME